MPLPIPIRIGTRGSPLALVQADLVRAALAALEPSLAEPGMLEIVPILTTGDRIQDRRLSEIGNKGLFVKEIERALTDRRIDLAVHSMKDVETDIDPSFLIAAILPREDPRDALLSLQASSIDTLPREAVIGTTSLRRQAQLLAIRPDLRATIFRGNVQTRLRKLSDGLADATLLAVAGLKRSGLLDSAACILDPSVMMPAVAQGAIGVECRRDDRELRELLERMNDLESSICVAAERAVLKALDGSCRTPVGALAEHSAGGLHLRAVLARPDGTCTWRRERRGSTADAYAMGLDLGRELRAAGDGSLFV